MGSNETAATNGGPQVIDVLTGNRAPSGPPLAAYLQKVAPKVWGRVVAYAACASSWRGRFEACQVIGGLVGTDAASAAVAYAV